MASGVKGASQYIRRFTCWTILVGRISLVKWTGVQLAALCLGVIVFSPFKI